MLVYALVLIGLITRQDSIFQQQMHAHHVLSFHATYFKLATSFVAAFFSYLFNWLERNRTDSQLRFSTKYVDMMYGDDVHCTMMIMMMLIK